jgi:sulfate/thiosulfate transport system substrate-binding protein
MTYPRAIGAVAILLFAGLCGCSKSEKPATAPVPAPGKDAAVAQPKAATAPVKHVLLNVSYDPTRELYAEYDKWFVAQEKAKGVEVEVKQSHGGSGKQARSVIEGLDADVVTLALSADVDAIVSHTQGKIPANWEKQLPENSCPYTSTIVFLVRKGNPKGIHDWGDLARDGVSVITPNPKTSGGARWNYLAAWAWADEQYNGDEARVRDYMSRLFHNVPVLDSGARGSTTTFVQRGIGDVLLAWENEAFLAMNEFGSDKFDIVVPALSIKAEPSVALVEGNAKAKGNVEVAQEYLKDLYTPAAQAMVARHYYRPCHPEMADAKDVARFPKIRMVTIDGKFGGWKKAQDLHFKDGGVFDQIYVADKPSAAAK